ncbi:hypothetical protein MTX80_08675 [Gordonia amicalis]|nr:hypothetical protein [Gordonia amicalis]UOG22954.1 hypothetical protein MTX80_08675 [Gordonia amicalis]
MIGNCEHGRDVERGAVDNAFGIGSFPLWLTMGTFACGYLVVTLYANAEVTGAWQWVGLIAGFLFFVAGGVLILDAPGDPLPVPTTLVISVLTVAGVTASLFSLPFPLTHVMQTGPPMGASVILLAFVAVRGRPLAAWLTSITISVVAVGWAHVADQGALWGLSMTLPGYAIMIMGSLFSLMLRPMARQLYALREANERQAAARRGGGRGGRRAGPATRGTRRTGPPDPHPDRGEARVQCRGGGRRPPHRSPAQRQHPGVRSRCAGSAGRGLARPPARGHGGASR